MSDLEERLIAESNLRNWLDRNAGQILPHPYAGIGKDVTLLLDRLEELRTKLAADALRDRAGI